MSIRRPLEVILDTTERCNLKCRMCYFSAVNRLQFVPFDRQLGSRGMMPTATFERIAQDLFPRAHRVALGCAAEPLVHPKFVDILREAGRHGVPDLWFPTNLLPLTPAKAEAICEAGVRTVGVSMDGTRAATYESIRVGGKFDRLLRSFELLNEVRRGTRTGLRLIFVWMQTNRADLADLPRFAEDMGARELDVRFVAPTAHVSAEDELLDGEDPAALRAELEATAADAAARGLRLVSYPDFDDGGPIGWRGHVLRWRAGLYDHRRLRGRWRTAVAGCAWPRHTIVVRPNGAVSPCIFWEEEPIGLYPEQSFEQIDRSPLLGAITDGLAAGNPCGTCRTCSERKHALYFRLQWQEQASERLEQLGVGPGAVGSAQDAGPTAERTTSSRASAAASATSTEPTASVWGLPQEVRAALNGDGSDWMTKLAPAEAFPRVLVIGDQGAAEALIQAGFAARIDVVDGSVPFAAGLDPEAGEGETRTGETSSVHRLAFDPREPALPVAAYPAAFAVGGLSAHLRLERLLAAVLDALEPGGFLIVDDYVGPERHEWNERTGSAARAAYEQLPATARRFAQLPLPPLEGDCARATRSRDIERLVRTGFRIQKMTRYGGDLVAPLGYAVDWSRAAGDQVRRLARGSLSDRPHYAVIVARPRTGWTRRTAAFRYRWGPRVRRLFVYEPRRARDLLRQAVSAMSSRRG